jgi:hypothetical protein
VPPLRFPRRPLFWLVLVFGVLLVLPVLPLLASFGFLTESPLQRYYSLAYVESAKIAGQRSATTPIVWLYKTAPGRHRILLTEARRPALEKWPFRCSTLSRGPGGWMDRRRGGHSGTGGLDRIASVPAGEHLRRP